MSYFHDFSGRFLFTLHGLLFANFFKAAWNALSMYISNGTVTFSRISDKEVREKLISNVNYFFSFLTLPTLWCLVSSTSALTKS